MAQTPYRSDWQGPSWEVGEDGELHAGPPPEPPTPAKATKTGASWPWWWLAGVVFFILTGVLATHNQDVPAIVSFAGAVICIMIAKGMSDEQDRQELLDAIRGTHDKR